MLEIPGKYDHRRGCGRKIDRFGLSFLLAYPSLEPTDTVQHRCDERPTANHGLCGDEVFLVVIPGPDQPQQPFPAGSLRRLLGGPSGRRTAP